MVGKCHPRRSPSINVWPAGWQEDQTQQGKQADETEHPNADGQALHMALCNVHYSARVCRFTQAVWLPPEGL